MPSEFINILEDPFQHPTIKHAFPLSTKVNPSNWLNLFSVSANVIGYIFGINWKRLYRLSPSEAHGNATQEQFDEFFNENFNNDGIIQQQIYKIVKLELDAKLLSEDYISTRQDQLHTWLYEFYKEQMLDNCSVTDSTLTAYQLELKLAYLAFTKILGTIFKDGIWLHISSFKKIYQFLGKNRDNHILLLPNHKSHVDYILLHYLFVRFELETPNMVIAGENLNVPIFGKIMKDLGALYIKRSFQDDVDFWYSQNLQNLVKFKMDNGPVVMELFIEGTRSRNGKLMHGKTGFLRHILQEIQLNSNTVPILSIPISIVYEKPLEFDDYLIELNGLDKTQESFRSILCNGLKYLQNDSNLNFGKIFVRFDDSFIQFDKYQDKDLFCEDILGRIHDISYVPEISILGMAILIKFYQEGQRKTLDLYSIIPIFQNILSKILSKTVHDDHLLPLLDYSNENLVIFFQSLIKKFLSKYINLDNNIIEIVEETALVYYKNSLLHFFISELFMVKSNNNLMTLDIITKIFGYEFLTNRLIKYETVEIQQDDFKTFHDLLDPFIESYELSFNHLIGVISITLKNWLHLIYLQKPKVTYKESLNKSNLLYAIHLLKRLKIIKTTKKNEIMVIDDSKLKLLKNYLHDLRIGNYDTQFKNEVSNLFHNVKL